MTHEPAIRTALYLYHLPSGVRAARKEPLPSNIVTLLEIVAGNPAVAEEAAVSTQRSVDEVRAAAAFFIEQILFAHDSDSYRLLGASPDQPSSNIRRNMALLSRWLHPDMSEDRAVLAGRLTRAWEDLKTPDRRANYDRVRKDRISRGSKNRRNGTALRALSTRIKIHRRDGLFGRLMRFVLGRSQQ